MDTIVIPFSKKKILLKSLMSLAFVAMGVLLIAVIANDQTRWPPLLIQAIGGLNILFFGVAAIAYLRLLFVKKPGIVLNDEGIINNSSYLSTGLLKWDDINALRIEQVKSTKFLIVYLNDPWQIIKVASGFKRWLMMGNMRRYNTPISISATVLDCSFEELEKWVTERFSKSIAQNQPA